MTNPEALRGKVEEFGRRCMAISREYECHHSYQTFTDDFQKVKEQHLQFIATTLIEAVESRIAEIKSYYPYDVFPEATAGDLKAVQELMESRGKTLDRLSADYFRKSCELWEPLLAEWKGLVE